MAKKSKALFEYDEARNVTAKTCSKCGTMTPIAAFAKDKRREGGVESSCKACKSIKDAEYRTKKSGKAVAVDPQKAQWEWEPVELTGKRQFGIMLQEMFPSEEFIVDYDVAGYVVDFYVEFAHTGVNYVDPSIEDTKRITEIRAEIKRREEEEVDADDIWHLVEVKPGRELDALRKIILIANEMAHVSEFMRDRMVDVEQVNAAKQTDAAYYSPAS